MNEIDPDDVRAIGRDPDAFEAFYRAHIESIGRFIARRVDDPQLVADLTSQIFLTAVEVAETYRPEKGTPASSSITSASKRGSARPTVSWPAGDSSNQTPWLASKNVSTPNGRCACSFTRWKNCPSGTVDFSSWWPSMGSRLPMRQPCWE
jgi:hypothetical protein